MIEPSRKPFWKRKRWIAAAVLWLVVMYPLSAGPAHYAVARGWMSEEPGESFYAPLDVMAEAIGLSAAYWRYMLWWYAIGQRHASD